jgi:hypothetical protein
MEAQRVELIGELRADTLQPAEIVPHLSIAVEFATDRRFEHFARDICYRGGAFTGDISPLRGL